MNEFSFSEQQAFLRKAIKTLGLTREGFSKMLNISIRRLNSWLLPTNSNGFRFADHAVLDRIYQVLRENSIKDGFITQLATLSSVVPIIYCEDLGFNYPSLYMVCCECESVDLQTGELNGLKERYIKYSLSDTDIPTAQNERIISVTPVSSLIEDSEAGWVFIREHRSIDRLDAYMSCIFEGSTESTCASVMVYTMADRIFSIYQIRKSELPNPEFDKTLSGLIIYGSDSYFRINTFFNGMIEEPRELIIDSNGNRVNSKFAHSLQP